MSRAKDIRTTIGYEQGVAAAVTTRRHAFLRALTPEEKTDFQNQQVRGNGVNKVTTIVNGRERDLELDRNGFTLVKSPCSLTTPQFYDPSKKHIVETYYREIESIVKKATGASHVLVFHHQLRNASRAISADGKDDAESIKVVNDGVAGYAGSVAHTDTSPASADALYLSLKQNMKRGRYMYLGLWRNIAQAEVQNNHLALLDLTSVDALSDYLPSEIHGPGYDVVIYRLSDRNHSRHRWVYFPAMHRDEVIVFKHYDSHGGQAGGPVFHCSVADPTASKGAPPRESIEVRCIACFPDSEIDSLPKASGDSGGGILGVLKRTLFG